MSQNTDEENDALAKPNKMMRMLMRQVPNTYGMFTIAGGKAVEEQTRKVLERLKTDNKLPANTDDDDDIMDIIYEIQGLVSEMGKGQVNPSKYAEDDQDVVKGFDEVHDTAVRERLYGEVIRFIGE